MNSLETIIYFFPFAPQEVKSFSTIDELETFILKHGENIVDLMGGEIDRIEIKLRVCSIEHFVQSTRTKSKPWRYFSRFLSFYRKNSRKYDIVIWRSYKLFLTQTLIVGLLLLLLKASFRWWNGKVLFDDIVRMQFY